MGHVGEGVAAEDEHDVVEALGVQLAQGIDGVGGADALDLALVEVEAGVAAMARWVMARRWAAELTPREAFRQGSPAGMK